MTPSQPSPSGEGVTIALNTKQHITPSEGKSFPPLTKGRCSDDVFHRNGGVDVRHQRTRRMDLRITLVLLFGRAQQCRAPTKMFAGGNYLSQSSKNKKATILFRSSWLGLPLDLPLQGKDIIHTSLAVHHLQEFFICFCSSHFV